MSTDSPSPSIERYSTGFGAGLLLWRRGVLVAHHLPSVDAVSGSFATLVDAATPWQGPMSGVAALLKAYFDGDRVEISADVPLETTGWSRFARHVGEALTRVPYGEATSYSELADAAGYPLAQRAVGNFLASNPFPVILPCHRIIRADGGLGNYSAGPDWKRRLHELEGISLAGV